MKLYQRSLGRDWQHWLFGAALFVVTGELFTIVADVEHQTVNEMPPENARVGAVKQNCAVANLASPPTDQAGFKLICHGSSRQAPLRSRRWSAP
jgi:hypothetical protein